MLPWNLKRKKKNLITCIRGKSSNLSDNDLQLAASEHLEHAVPIEQLRSGRY